MFALMLYSPPCAFRYPELVGIVQLVPLKVIPEKLMLLAWLSRFAPESSTTSATTCGLRRRGQVLAGERLVVDDAVRVVQVPLTGLRDECLGRLPVERRAGVRTGYGRWKRMFDSASWNETVAL